VAAVPGPISNDLSAGSNRLIADGAMAIIDPDSLCEAAGLARPGKGPIVPVELEGTFEAVRGERLEAELASAPDGGSRILADVARLELIGAIIRDGGGGWQARS
jgi:predicted Rossmann fold nucleotide-binding protein DprA/Smf involved in DNA uptake